MNDSLVEASLLSGAVIGQICIVILGIILMTRAASFYGSVCACVKNRLAILSLGYFVSAFVLMSFWWAGYLSRHSNATSQLIFNIWQSLFVFNVCLFYITIIYRVYISFKSNNEYKLSRLELICLALFVVWQLGFMTCAAFYNILDKLEYAIMFIIVLCIDIAFNITILYIFLKRLYQMILSLDESFEALVINMDEVRMNSDNIDGTIVGTDRLDDIDHYDQDKNHNMPITDANEADLPNDEIEIRDRMQKISMHETEVVNMMAKISLLTIISEIFINSSLIMIVYLNIDEAHGNYITNDVYTILEQLFLIIGFCINCFTLYATFIFNDDHYMKCCGFYHTNLKKCCVICVTRKTFRHGRL